MVFCYKIITESPMQRRSGSVSPIRKEVSPSRIPEISSTLSEFLESIDYQKYGSKVIEAVPEHEWRLLATLARKRNQELQREQLADEFQKIWQKEKMERELLAAETMNQYKYYIHKKREQDRLVQDFRSMQRETDEKAKKLQLMDNIRYKEKRTADQLNWTQDNKAKELVEKALELEARGLLAADRRLRSEAAAVWKRRAEMEEGLRRINNAAMKRDAIVRNSAKKAAISNAMNSWESTILKQETLVLEEFKRAQHLARAELTTLRSLRIARGKAQRERQARQVAAFTQQLREAVRGYRPSSP